MKIRHGFVSNSSSSSFVCSICNRAEEIYDNDFSCSEFIICQVGHVFCSSHAKSLPEAETARALYEPHGPWEELALPPSKCPICQLELLETDTLLTLLIEDSGFKTRDAVEQHILTAFSSYSQLEKRIRDIRNTKNPTEKGA